MSLSGDRNRLVSLTRELAVQWEETKPYWRDARSAEFEHEYLEELFARVARADGVIDRLDELLQQIRSECE